MDDMMRAMFGGGRGQRDEQDTRDPEAALMDLREVYRNFAQAMTNGCPFAPGDIVTPREGYNTKGVGRPHIVLAVIPVGEVKPIFVGETPESSAFGHCPDMRIASFYGDARAAHWVESYEFETYAEAHRRKADEANAALKAVDAAA